ncbi:ankyrin repeat protein, partial [Reticulomyxa filosa]
MFFCSFRSAFLFLLLLFLLGMLIFLELLIELESSVNILLFLQVKIGQCFFILICFRKRKVLEKLLKEHPDWLNGTNQKGETCLIAAIDGLQYEKVEYLLSFGEIDVNGGGNGQSALFAAINAHDEGLAKQLLKRGASCNTIGPDGRHILYHAISQQMLSLADNLFAQVELNFAAVAPETGENVFHWIVETRNIELLNQTVANMKRVCALQNQSTSTVAAN